MVDMNGKENTLPNNLNRTSPGKRPTPSFSSQGSNAENTSTPIKMTNTQRIILHLPGQGPVSAASWAEPEFTVIARF